MFDAMLNATAGLNWVLLGAVLVSWLATAFALLSLKRTREQERRTLSVLAGLQHDLSVNSHGLVGMGKKLLTIEKAIKPGQQSKSQSKMVAENSNHSDGSNNVVNLADQQDKRYRQARLMLGQGLSTEQVANAAGISQAEASLLAMLRSPGKALG